MSASPEDLEEGELPSSDDDEAISNSKSCKTASPLDNSVSSIDTDKDVAAADSEAIRKRPFESPEPENLDKDESSSKKPKFESSEASDLEDGEIYSDDEEAAYYPQLVKNRFSECNNGTRQNIRESRRSSLRRYGRSHSRSPVSREDYPRHRHANHEKDDRLSTDRGKTYSPAQSRGQKSGWRDRNSSGRSRVRSHGYNYSGGSNLIGQPIRHDRSDQSGDTGSMWEEFPQHSNQLQPTLTLEVLESRLKQGLAILPTPNTNCCDSLDEFNYPAMPQWYQKAVNAYNKRMGYNRGGLAWKGTHQDDGMTRMDIVAENVGYNYVPLPLPPPPPPIKPTPLFANDEPLNISPVPSSMNAALPPAMPVVGQVVPQQPVTQQCEPVIKPLFDPEMLESFPKSETENTYKDIQLERSLSEPSGLSIQIDDHEENGDQASLSDITPVDSPFTEDIPPPLSVAMETSEDFKPSLTVTTLFTQSVGKKGRNTTKARSNKRPSKQQRIPKQLIVSIDLQKIHMRTDDTLEGMPLLEEEFNYDDYLDQLNDEEEEDKKPSVFESGFWIDTNPKSKTNSASSSSTNEMAPLLDNPLDEDFPTFDSSTKDGSGGVKMSSKPSLRSLVERDSVDRSVVVEEGKQTRSSRGKRGGKKSVAASLKYLEKSYWTKQEKKSSTQPSHNQVKDALPPQQEQQQQQASLLTNSGTDTPPGQKLTQPCKYYLQGYCIHGDNCQYNHAVPREKKREMCKFYLQDACDKGDNCIFYHGDFPCKYFHARHMCYHGDKCKFSHAPLTQEGYELLMGVLEPNLRDQVTYPGHQLPADIQTQPPLLPGAIPVPVPNPVLHPNLHPGLLGPVPPIIQDPALQIRDPPTNCAQPMLGSPPHPQAANYLQIGGLSQGQQYPVIEPLPDPHSNTYPQTHSTGMIVPPSSVMQDNAPPSVTCNVSLPVSFDVLSLFPDEHPQVLPHDLATKLRKVLLETPSSTSEKDKKKQEEEEKFELFYWENTDRPESSMSTEPGDLNLQSEPTVSAHQPLTYETRPSYPGGDFAGPGTTSALLPTPASVIPHAQGDMGIPPTYQGAVIIGPSPPRPDGGDIAPSFRSPLQEDIRGGTAATPPDPRRTYPLAGSQKVAASRMSPDPRQDPRFVKMDQHISPSPPTRSFDTSRVSSQPFPADLTSRSYSHSNLISTLSPDTTRKVSTTDTCITNYSIPRNTPHEPSSGSVWGGVNESSILKSSDRLTDPRKKYAHLKIKSKSALPPLTEPSQKKTSSSPLPELLRDSSILDKPIDPKDLFSTYPKGISLFGSGNQLGSDSETNEFGEIKMQSSSTTDKSVCEDSEKSVDPEEEVAPVIPSYLTHLDLDNDDEDDLLKIDSAFGSLQARKRRLSEQNSSVTSVVSESFGQDSKNKDPPTSKISDMFSFGSSLY